MLDLGHVPLEDKVKFHKIFGEMLCNELSKNAITIDKAKKLLEKAATRLKQEKSNSRALNMQNASYKELIVKMGVDPVDITTIESLIKISQKEIQELRRKLKMPSSEHVQTQEISLVEAEKEILSQYIINRNNEIILVK